jgi:hypothetical protein
MLKTVAITTTGILSYQGTWNASTNVPTLTSSVGVANQYYVVSNAGSTNLNGITNWQVGDWAIFNGSIWEKVDGGSYGAVTQVQGNGTVNGITLTGNVTSSGNITLGGTLSNVSLTSQVTGTLPVGNGGTGAVSLSSGSFVIGNGTSALTTGALGVNANGALTIQGSAGSNSQVLISTGGGTLNQFSNTLSSISISNVTISSGTINVQATNHTATTNSNATMSTASIPLVPQGYMLFDLNGTVVKVPYYAV